MLSAGSPNGLSLYEAEQTLALLNEYLVQVGGELWGGVLTKTFFLTWDDMCVMHTCTWTVWVCRQ